MPAIAILRTAKRARKNKKAKENGVHIWAYDCAVTDRSMKLDAPVPVIL